jgi:hypothetical protein
MDIGCGDFVEIKCDNGILYHQDRTGQERM